MKEDIKIVAVRFIMLSENFLQLVENVLLENINSNNNDIYIGDKLEDSQTIEEGFKRNTRWSDFRILIPTLFNFFHGMELLLKGAKYKYNPIPPGKKPTHNLNNLFNDFKTHHYEKTEMINIFQKYIYPDSANTSILKEFYSQNNIRDSSRFYEIFKYPSSASFSENFNYQALTKTGKNGIDFFQRFLRI